MPEVEAAHGHHGPEEPSYTAESLTVDVANLFRNPGPWFRTWTMVSGVLFVIGIIGLILKFIIAPAPQHWGYYIATLGFILSTFVAAPIPAIAARLTKGAWRRPITRAAELYAFVGVLVVLMAIPAFFVLPARIPGQRSLWFSMIGFMPGAPYVYDFLALAFLAVCGIGLVYAASRPDLATLKNRGITGGLTRWAAPWVGNFKQWRVAQSSLTPFGAFYIAMFVFVGLVFSTDFTQSLVPGWFDSIYPAYYAIAGMQGGIAMLLVTMGLLRLTPYRQYIPMEPFWNLSKILLALTLLWFYFWWAAFILFWYGKLPREEAVLQLLMFGPSIIVPFGLAWFCSFGIPLFLLIWNPVRKSIRGPVIVSIIILIGNFFNQIRLFVPVWALDTHTGEMVEHLPAFMWPDIADILIIPGFIGGAVFVYLLALRYIPVLNIWELKEGLLYRQVRQFLMGRVAILSKPE